MPHAMITSTSSALTRLASSHWMSSTVPSSKCFCSTVAIRNRYVMVGVCPNRKCPSANIVGVRSPGQGAGG